MIKAIIFDIDGVLIKREKYFSERYAEEFDVPLENLLPFFRHEFDECLTGKRDLKKEIEKRLADWQWKGGVDELLEYWFSHEAKVESQILESVKKLRDRGIKCYLGTDNDPYRAEYILNRVGLKEYFDGVFASGYLGLLKKDIRFWKAAADSLANIKTEEILVWDDDKDNIARAKEFGIKAELFTNFNDYIARMKRLV